jgi:hypothetical protein
MPKAPRATDSTTPKKRTRKAKVEPENSTEVVEVATQTASAQEVESKPNLEEKIRVRAYELYLQRKGRGGSPEQDWLQAVAEIYSQVGV